MSRDFGARNYSDRDFILLHDLPTRDTRSPRKRELQSQFATSFPAFGTDLTSAVRCRHSGPPASFVHEPAVPGRKAAGAVPHSRLAVGPEAGVATLLTID